MPKSHKRWASYELMLKRVKKRAYRIEEVMYWDPSNISGCTTPFFTRDLRHPVTIAAYREIRARDRAWWAEIHAVVLALAAVFHPRLGENSLWCDLPPPIMHMIVREAYITRD